MQQNGLLPWGSDPEDVGLLNFIIEKTKDVKSPMSRRLLATDFATMRRCYENRRFFYSRITAFCAALNKLELAGRYTKIKMLFALSVSINKKLLKKYRMDALVEVDEYGRITRYRTKNGSLELEGDHSQIKQLEDKELRVSPESTKRAAEEVPDYPSKMYRENNWQPQNYAPFQSYPWMPESIGTLNHPGIQVPRIDHRGPGANYLSSGHSGSFWHLNQETREYAPLQSYPLSGSIEIQNHPVLQEPEDVKPKFTSKLKFLEAIKSLVIFLDTPSLSRIRLKIQRKIWKIGDSSAGISNDEMISAMDLLVARIANHSVSDLPEYVESVSFKEFLCYLKAAILNSKLEGLEVLLEKIKEKNKETAVMDRRIPVEKVVSVLQNTLDFIWSYLFC